MGVGWGGGVGGVDERVRVRGYTYRNGVCISCSTCMTYIGCAI